MKAIEIIDAIFKQGITNDFAGIITIGDTPKSDCLDYFGDYSVIYPPKPNTKYLYEWLHYANFPELGISNALLIQPRGDETMLIYLYEIEE